MKYLKLEIIPYYRLVGTDYILFQINIYLDLTQEEKIKIAMTDWYKNKSNYSIFKLIESKITINAELCKHTYKKITVIDIFQRINKGEWDSIILSDRKKAILSGMTKLDTSNLLYTTTDNNQIETWMNILKNVYKKFTINGTIIRYLYNLNYVNDKIYVYEKNRN